MAGPGNLPVERLKGSLEHNNWKFLMQAYLEQEGLWGCVTGDTTAVAEMAKARGKSVPSVDSANFTYIRNVKTPTEI